MTALEGLALVFQSMVELRLGGIEVRIEDAALRDDPEVVRRHDNPDTLPATQWVRVLFVTDDRDAMSRVKEAAQSLREAGVRFDTGMHAHNLVWHLDWSLRAKDI